MTNLRSLIDSSLNININIIPIPIPLSNNHRQMKRDDQEISYATNRKNIQKAKIVFVGDQYVGKTSVITRFIKNTFETQRNPTIGIDFVSKNIALGGKMMRLQLWDTAGQERFRSLIPNYIRDCQAALILFDLTNEQSFQNLSKWIDFVKQHRGEDAVIIIIGNKIDLASERKVTHQAIANSNFCNSGIKYYQLSAKTGENIEKMFQELCAQLMNINGNNLPSLQIHQSKVIQTKTVQSPRMEENLRKSQLKQAKEEKKVVSKVSSKVSSTKLTKKTVEQERRIKQKQCC